MGASRASRVGRPREHEIQDPQIVALGGGGFSMEPTNPLLDDYVLGLATAKQPRILFLPTASGDETGQINAFWARFADRLCLPEHVSLFRLREARRPLREILAEQDIVYVGGGSMRKHARDLARPRARPPAHRGLAQGVVLAGLSAGAMCWFQGGVSCSSGAPSPLAGLGLLEGSLTVHADGEPEPLPAWLAGVRDGTLPGGWALDDGVGLLFRGRQLQHVVSSRPGAGVQRVDAIAGELVRHRLEPVLLGKDRRPARGDVDEAVAELRRVRRLRRGITDGRG